MLEIRPVCEHCCKKLPAHSADAMICSFECTFCKDCVDKVLHNVCPNCGGGLEKRPVRPQEKVIKYPPVNLKIHNPVKAEQFEAMLLQYKNIPPEKR
jgi:uncharacterized protein